MIECHISECENHMCHTFGEDEGPFCTLNKCDKSSGQMVTMMKNRRKITVYEFVPEEEKVVMKEFMVVCSVIFSFLGAVSMLTWWLS